MGKRKPYEVKVSRDILKKLWSPYFLYYLTSIREFDYDYCYDEIIANNSFNSKKLNILFDEFLSWFYNNDDKEKELLKLAFVNRQPTLWRHGIPVLRLIPEDNNYKTIGVSPLTVEPYNADFDGDNMAIYIIHSIDALKEMEKKAYLKNTVRKDSDMSFLSRIRHEALYASFILTENKIIENNNNIIKINKLSELPNIDNIEWWNNKLNFPVNINGKIYSFGKCLFNLWCGFKNDIKIDFEITKSETNKLDEIIYNDCNKNSELFYERLTILIQMLLYFVSVTKHCPSINVNEMINILTENEEKIFNNLPENNPFIGYIINDSIIERCIKNWNKDSTFYKLFKSGSRFSKQQLARQCINIGYSADSENIIVPTPIKTNLMKGLTNTEAFLCAPGTRKGIIDKENATPESGYTERTLTMALSPLEIAEDDCHTPNPLEITIFNKKHFNSLIGKFIVIDNSLKEITINDYHSLIGKKVLLRSPITCITPDFKMCRKCFGNRLFPTKYVGITAAQISSERLTQLTMRSFHTSGAANLDYPSQLKTFLKDHLIDLKTDNDLIKLYIDDSKNLKKNIKKLFYKIPGFLKFDNEKIIFSEFNNKIQNRDVISVLSDVKSILKTNNKPTMTPSEYYEKLILSFLEVGTAYSSFIEMMLANSFLVDKKEIKFWRYNQNEKIVKKLGDKTVAKHISYLLGLMFEPNKISLSKFNHKEKSLNKMNIYEKIWFGYYDENYY
jgi:hypothetical protein